MRDLQKIYIECLLEIQSLGIPVGNIESVEWARFRKKYGNCIRSRDNTFKIQISYICKKEDIHLDDLKGVICHELLHTCDGCFNHENLWMKYASMVDEAYGYGVAVCKTTFDFQNRDDPVLYHATCSHCGGKWDIRNPDDYAQFCKGTAAHCIWCKDGYYV